MIVLPEERKRKYTDKQIMKIVVLLNIVLAIDFKIIKYNLMMILNILFGKRPKEIKRTVIC